MYELSHAYDLVLMIETIEGLRNKFLKWKEAFESKGLKVSLGKSKVMISIDITMDGMCKSNDLPCWVSSLRVMANSAMSVQCGRWNHGRCAKMRGVLGVFRQIFTCRKCEWNIGEAVEQEKKLPNAMKIAREVTYLGDRVSTCGGYEAAVTARTRCEWVKLRECSEFLCGRKFYQKQKGVVYESYVRP